SHVSQKRNWRVPLVREFFPTNPNLLGVNINRGKEICIRLRPYHDEKSFLEFDLLVGTMLHELVHGPHDARFYALLNELNAEYDHHLSRDFREAFEGAGRRIGGPPAGGRAVGGRTAAAAAAEARVRAGQPVGGRRLGGVPTELGALEKALTPGEMAVIAAERRARDRIWCG
ncbi:WLM domain-containing protein, partial [Blyttiomyces helicus]